MVEEYGYHPIETDFARLAGGQRPASLLIVGSVAGAGDLLSECVDGAAEVRLQVDSDVHLPRGVYWFDGWREAMIVTGPALAVAPLTASSEQLAADDHPLVNAQGWARHWWQGATPLKPPEFQVHDEAMVNPGGVIVDLRRRTYASGQWMYEARIDGRLSMIGEASLSTVPGLAGPLEWVTEDPVPAERFATTLTRAKLRDRFTDTVFSFRATKTIFRSYQFKPIMKVLQTGRSRLLIADEVGLGKTIEAGLVWTELEARGDADRVLVVCPAVLVAKWRQEMEERFAFDLIELNASGLRDLLAKASTGRLPNRAAYVVSLQLLRAWDSLEEFAEFQPTFDLVVVDEAHAMRNTETASFALGSLLSDWARSLVFLTATPVNLRSADLYSLMRLLQPGELGDQFTFELQLEPNAVLHRLQVSLFEDGVSAEQRIAMLDELKDMMFGRPLLARPEARLLRDLLSESGLSASAKAQARRLLLELNTTSAVVTRTRKVEVQEDKAVREPRSIEVEWGDVESAFYGQYLAWCVRRAILAGTPLNFSMQMPLRLASSCLPAAAVDVLKWKPGRPVDDGGDGPGAEVTPSQAEPPQPELVEAARALAGTDSKLDRLLDVVDMVKEERRQALLFTFSRATLDYLARQLAGRARVAVLHGGVDKLARHQVMADFRAGQYDLVLATRVASEGLDFEFCSVLVNYDLPWNPMEVEQRIGRLDRIGQRSEKILIVNFHTPGTIESTILQRVLDRIGVFERSIGELEPIVQDRWRDLRQAAFDFSLSEEQRALKTDQVLAAIETQAIDLRELQAASDYLLTTDDAPVDGMEEDLVRSGRYVGQRELALLLNDWAQTCGARPGVWADESGTFRFRGNSVMAKQVEGLVGSGVRSRPEVQGAIDSLRSESELFLALDQETSRTTGLDLLTASHPLTLAAVRVPGHEQARYACVRMPAQGVKPGWYLVQSAVATWEGVRPTKELWHAVVDLETLTPAPEVGDLLFAAVATGSLLDARPSTIDLAIAVARTSELLLERHVAEESERRAVNDALVETRLASAGTMHTRKLADLQARRQALMDKNDVRMASLFEAQVRHEMQRYERLASDLAEKHTCHLYVEPLAVCVVEVAK